MPPEPRDDEHRRSNGHTATLPPSPASATAARHLVRRLLPASTSEHLATVELLTTELVANAVIHARTPCHLQLSYPRDGVLRVEVTDEADGTPSPLTTQLTDDHGRGLQLIAALASHWGTTHTAAAGKTVWFETQL